MSELFVSDNASELYLELRDALLERGREVSPRGQRTLEIPAVTVVLEDPTSPAPTGVGRGLVPQIGAAEAAGLIGGYSDANLLINCAKNFAMFVEGPAGDRLMGAYGPRARPQWERVIKQLVTDPSTRQAGLNLWRYDELAVPSKDVPCTLSLYYQIREGRLEAFTTMRSQDLVWGSPYDWMQFTAAQRALAHALGVGLGPYTHHCYSLHAYVDRDDLTAWEPGQDHEFEQPPEYMVWPDDGSNAFTVDRGTPVREELALDRWRWIADDMLELAVPGAGDSPVSPFSHGWYYELLRSRRSGGRLCPHCRYVLPKTEAHWPEVYDRSGTVGFCRVCATES